MSLTEYTRDTLTGLTGVIVIVEDVKDDARAAGLSALELQTDVELKLSGAGIHVLRQAEWRQAPGRPWLYVSVNTLRYLASHFFSIDVQLKQDVSLSREPSRTTSAATWEMGSIGFVDTLHLSSKVRESVSAYLDDFIRDYVAVNLNT